MAELKTRATEVDVDAFLAAVQPDERRRDGEALRAMFTRVTGEPARMWGPSIVGFGSYRYRYESGHSGVMCRVGFSPRKAELVLYVLAETDAQAELLARLGKHRTGKGCLYVKRLSAVDPDVLEQIVLVAFDFMNRTWPDSGEPG